MKLMCLEEYRETRFTERSRPSLVTLKRWVTSNKVPGMKKGGRYYVDIDAENNTLLHPLALRVLENK